MITEILKRLYGILFFYTGLFHVVRFIHNVTGKRLTIVTYHRITNGRVKDIEASLPYLFTSTTNFRKHLQFIKKWYKVTSFQDMSSIKNGNELPWNSLIITFDDGYEDNYQAAYPILKELDLPATLFVAVDSIENQDQNLFWWDRLYYYFGQLRRLKENGQITQQISSEILALFEQFCTNPSQLFAQLNELDGSTINELALNLRDLLCISDKTPEKENRMMNWDHLYSMQNYVDCGSHTCSHSNLVKMDVDQQAFEISESKKIIEKKTSKKVHVLSYPCGIFNDRLKDAACRLGYECAVTTIRGINNLSDRYALKRINIWEGTSLSLNGTYAKGYFAYKLVGF